MGIRMTQSLICDYGINRIERRSITETWVREFKFDDTLVTEEDDTGMRHTVARFPLLVLFVEYAIGNHVFTSNVLQQRIA